MSFPLPVVDTEAFWVVILSEHHQQASFKPWSEVHLAPGPENCPPRAKSARQNCVNTKRARFYPWYASRSSGSGALSGFLVFMV